MTESQRQAAISLLAVLLLARFVFVPWQQSQDVVIDEQQVSAKRLQRAAEIAAVEPAVQEQLTKLTNLQTALSEQLPALPAADQAAQFTQQLLQSHFEGDGVTVALFNFEGLQPLSDPQLNKARISIRLSAPAGSLFKTLSALQQKYPYLQLLQWTSSELSADLAQPYEVFLTLDLLVKLEQH